jgi:hypothetical protein
VIVKSPLNNPTNPNQPGVLNELSARPFHRFPSGQGITHLTIAMRDSSSIKGHINHAENPYELSFLTIPNEWIHMG